MGRKSDKVDKDHISLKQTILVSLKKNRDVEAVEKRKTSFLELFFDLAVVFVIALLASHFANYIGVSPENYVGQSNGFIVSHSEIGLLSWIMNFLFLWRIWYRYGVLFRTHGNEGVLSHGLTILLILVLAVQAISIVVPTSFFFTYGLVISYISGKAVIIVYEIILTYLKIRNGLKTKKEYRSVLYEMIALLVFVLSTIIYISLVEKNKIGVEIKGGKQDIWQLQLYVSLALALTVLIDLAISFSFRGRSRELNELQIYNHTKERHHLLVIIALGESVLFNIGDHVANNREVVRMIPELILNLLIVIMIWTAYKAYVYRVTYLKGGRNMIVYTITHIFIIISMMLMFSSLEAYADAESKYYDLNSMTNQLGGGIVNFAALDDLKHALFSTYPIIYLTGLITFFMSMVIMIWLPKFGDDIYDEVIRIKKPLLMLKLSGIALTALVFAVAFALGVQINLVWVFVGIFIVLLAEFIVGTLRTNKIMLKVTGRINKAVEELNQLEK